MRIRRHKHRWGYGTRIYFGPFFLDVNLFKGGTMSTEGKHTNQKGLDSSAEKNPQSPQARAGHAQDYSKFTKGTVKTK